MWAFKIPQEAVLIKVNLFYIGVNCCLLQWLVPIHDVRGFFYFFVAFAGCGEVRDKVPHPSHSLAGGGCQHPTASCLLCTVSADKGRPGHYITMIGNIKGFLLFLITQPLRWKGREILMQFGLFGYSPCMFYMLFRECPIQEECSTEKC